MLVFGTRPEAIKMASLVKEFQKYPELFKTIVAVTGQHREMLDQVLLLFKIVPDFDLNIMKEGQDLYDVTSRVLLGLRGPLTEASPDVVLVHGDTTTSISAALAAFYKQIPVAHIEAGLRTYNKYSPWPEELNRQLTSRIATYNFAPTNLSRDHLIAEGVADSSITVTGNTGIDSLFLIIDQLNSNAALSDEVQKSILKAGLHVDILTNDKRKVLITGHRRENFGDGFINICRAIKDLGASFQEVDFIYPMHLNPNVRKPIQETFGNNKDKWTNIHFIEPLDYLPFVYLMNKSYLILTDSGGIQEEAPSLGKPVLVMRDTTERPEAFEAGTVKLVGTDYHKIVAEVTRLLEDQRHYEKMSKTVNPFGDGFACPRIVKTLK